MDPRDPITVEGVKLHTSQSVPVAIRGKHSGRDLAGIDVSLTAYNKDEAAVLESFFSKENVTVIDPFVGRTYDATVSQKSCSYREGQPERHFIAEIREVDKAPNVSELEINGQKYAVLKYYEDDPTDNVVGMHALLRMSDDEFRLFNKTRDSGPPLEVRRMGTDETPFRARFGGQMFWSKHDDGKETYYKHIVRLFPAEFMPESINIATGSDHLATSQALFDTMVCLEALIQELRGSGVISQTQRDVLLSDRYKLLDPVRREEIAWEFKHQADAEEHF